MSFITPVNKFVLKVRFDFYNYVCIFLLIVKKYIYVYILWKNILMYESQLFLNKPVMVEKLIVPLWKQ